MDDADRHLETAITALKASRDAIRDAQDPEPADLSSTVAMVRELAWSLDSVVKRVAERYDKAWPVGHDHCDDPARCVEMIRLRLDDVIGQLGDIDSALEHTHGLAAKLHRP